MFSSGKLNIIQYRLKPSSQWRIEAWWEHGSLIMALILDGSSLHVAHAWRKIRLFEGEEKDPICEFSWSNLMPYTDQIAVILHLTCEPYVKEA